MSSIYNIGFDIKFDLLKNCLESSKVIEQVEKLDYMTKNETERLFFEIIDYL